MGFFLNKSRRNNWYPAEKQKFIILSLKPKKNKKIFPLIYAGANSMFSEHYLLNDIIQ